MDIYRYLKSLKNTVRDITVNITRRQINVTTHILDKIEYHFDFLWLFSRNKILANVSNTSKIYPLWKTYLKLILEKNKEILNKK